MPNYDHLESECCALNSEHMIFFITLQEYYWTENFVFTKCAVLLTINSNKNVFKEVLISKGKDYINLTYKVFKAGITFGQLVEIHFISQ